MADQMTEWETRFDDLASGKVEADATEIERLRAQVREGWSVMTTERLMAIAGLFGIVEKQRAELQRLTAVTSEVQRRRELSAHSEALREMYEEPSEPTDPRPTGGG